MTRSPDMDKEYSLLRRLKTMLNGVPPPVSVTTSKVTVEEILEKYAENEEQTGLCIASENVTCNPLFEKDPSCLHYLNRSQISEESAELMQKIQSRYILMETMSSCNIWFKSSLLSTSNVKKKSKNQSPGHRLSHLARRVQTFSSENLKQMANSNRRRHIEIKKNGRLPRQTLGLNRSVQYDKLNSSKRALFMSPEDEPANKSLNSFPRRKLFSSSEKKKKPVQRPEFSRWSSQQNFCEERNRKRCREEIFDHGSQRRKCPRRSLTFTEDDECSRSSTTSSTHSGSSVPAVLSSAAAAPFRPLKDIHKKKLLMAVYEALRKSGVYRKDSIFQPCASTLFNICSSNIEQILASHTKNDLSYNMLHFAQQHVVSVVEKVRTKKADSHSGETSNRGVLSLRQNEANVLGWIGDVSQHRDVENSNEHNRLDCRKTPLKTESDPNIVFKTPTKFIRVEQKSGSGSKVLIGKRVYCDTERSRGFVSPSPRKDSGDEQENVSKRWIIAETPSPKSEKDNDTNSCSPLKSNSSVRNLSNKFLVCNNTEEMNCDRQVLVNRISPSNSLNNTNGIICSGSAIDHSPVLASVESEYSLDDCVFPALRKQIRKIENSDSENESSDFDKMNDDEIRNQDGAWESSKQLSTNECSETACEVPIQKNKTLVARDNNSAGTSFSGFSPVCENSQYMNFKGHFSNQFNVSDVTDGISVTENENCEAIEKFSATVSGSENQNEEEDVVATAFAELLSENKNTENCLAVEEEQELVEADESTHQESSVWTDDDEKPLSQFIRTDVWLCETVEEVIEEHHEPKELNELNRTTNEVCTATLEESSIAEAKSGIWTDDDEKPLSVFVRPDVAQVSPAESVSDYQELPVATEELGDPDIAEWTDEDEIPLSVVFKAEVSEIVKDDESLATAQEKMNGDFTKASETTDDTANKRDVQNIVYETEAVFNEGSCLIGEFVVPSPKTSTPITASARSERRKRRKLIVKKTKPNWKVIKETSDDGLCIPKLKLKMKLSHEWEVVSKFSSGSELDNSSQLEDVNSCNPSNVSTSGFEGSDVKQESLWNTSRSSSGTNENCSADSDNEGDVKLEQFLEDKKFVEIELCSEEILKSLTSEGKEGAADKTDTHIESLLSNSDFDKENTYEPSMETETERSCNSLVEADRNQQGAASSPCSTSVNRTELMDVDPAVEAREEDCGTADAQTKHCMKVASKPVELSEIYSQNQPIGDFPELEVKDKAEILHLLKHEQHNRSKLMILIQMHKQAVARMTTNIGCPEPLPT